VSIEMRDVYVFDENLRMMSVSLKTSMLMSF